MKFLKDMITGIDGESFDVGRVLWIFGALSFLAISIYHAWRHGVFDPMSFGGGYSGILASGGAALKFKADTEPQA